jgi:hypothetical protein
MKRGIFIFAISLIVFIFLFMNFISAAYVCSQNSTVKEDIKEIILGKTKLIEGISLGLIRADEAAAIKRVDVDLFVDAQSATLNDNTLIPITFMNGKVSNISLISSTEGQANIKIDSNNKNLSVGDIETIGEFDVFLFSSDGVYPGTASVMVVVGKDSVSLNNMNNPSKIVTVEGKEYGLELFSASDTNALIKVSRCDNETSKLTWVIVNKSEQNITLNNETIGDLNATNNSTINNTVDNSTINATNTTGNNNQGAIQENAKSNGIPMIYFYIGIPVVVILIFVFITLYIWYKKPDQSQEAQQQTTAAPNESNAETET